MSQVTFSQCLEKGIQNAAWGAGWGALFGRSLPMVASSSLGQLIGVTTGNYLVHNTEVFKDFEDTTKQIIVVALVALTSTAVFGGFTLASRTTDLSKFASSQISGALINYWIGWQYVQPQEV